MSYLGIVPSGHFLDVPNALLGAAYYFYRLVLDEELPLVFSQLAASGAMAASLFLAYKLTVLEELCILCWTTHVLNLLLFIDAFAILPRRVKQKSS